MINLSKQDFWQLNSVGGIDCLSDSNVPVNNFPIEFRVEYSSKDNLRAVIQLLAAEGRQSLKIYTRMKASFFF